MAFPLQFLLEALVRTTLMPKDKKKHSKKDQSSEDILDLAHVSLKKFRKVTREIGKLSTGQKLVGGIVLAAAGLAYLATRQTDEAAAQNTSAEAAAIGSGSGADESSPQPARKVRKGLRASSE
jgi:hypothetical protein